MTFSHGLLKTAIDIGTLGRALSRRVGDPVAKKHEYFPKIQVAEETATLRRHYPHKYRELKKAIQEAHKVRK